MAARFQPAPLVRGMAPAAVGAWVMAAVAFRLDLHHYVGSVNFHVVKLRRANQGVVLLLVGQQDNGSETGEARQLRLLSATAVSGAKVAGNLNAIQLRIILQHRKSAMDKKEGSMGRWC